MLRGENIVCFSKEWSEDPTSNNHVLRVLSKHNNVLWINSIAMRSPSLGSGQDLRKIARKARTLGSGPQRVGERLWVYTPIVLPLPHSELATRINRLLLRRSLSRLRRRLHMDRYQLWTFLPNAVEHLGMGEELVVYYCIDDWSQFSYLDRDRILAMERRLCERADVVFATARSLFESKRDLNSETHFAPHGVDHAHFAKALDADTPVAQELGDLPRPILGFFGLIQDWIDLPLLARLAEKRPDWTIAILGKALVDTGLLSRFPNVHLLGRRPYEQLPGFCKGFSVGLMPFVKNELTRAVNPIKMREYLSAGLGVVSTDLPEARSYSGACRIAGTPEEFIAACEAALKEDTQEQRLQRSAVMSRETWDGRVEQIGQVVQRVLSRKRTMVK
jgi:glycosyltransferase involved in cell wall biosynthesis